MVFLRCQPLQKQVQFNDETETTNLPLTAFTREEDIHPIFSSVTPTSHSVTVSLGPFETGEEFRENPLATIVDLSVVTNKLVKKHNDYPSVRRYFSHMFPKVYVPKARYSRKKIKEDEQKARRQAKLLFLEAWPGNRLSTTKERYNLRRI